jgi:hypothetical protein
MKKSLIGILLCLSILFVSAQDSTTHTTTTTTTTHKYYYDPSSNVYFDQSTGTYWYQDKGSTEWSKTQSLPSTIIVDKTQQVPIDVSGSDPWKNNTADIKKYKIKKNGTVKIKTRDNN